MKHVLIISALFTSVLAVMAQSDSTRLEKKVRFGLALGITSHILLGVQVNWANHSVGSNRNNEQYPYYTTDTTTEVESFRNAFGFVHANLPTIEFNALIKNNNQLGAGFGYRNSSRQPDGIVYLWAINQKNYHAYLQYSRLVPLDRQGKKRKFFYVRAKVSGYYKELNYSWSSIISGSDIDLNYEEHSRLGLLQLSPGFRFPFIKKAYMDVGINLNLFAFASGSYHTTFYDTDFVQVFADIDYKDDYSKTLFMKKGFAFNDFTLKVGYMF